MQTRCRMHEAQIPISKRSRTSPSEGGELEPSADEFESRRRTRSRFRCCTRSRRRASSETRGHTRSRLRNAVSEDSAKRERRPTAEPPNGRTMTDQPERQRGKALNRYGKAAQQRGARQSGKAVNRRLRTANGERTAYISRFRRRLRRRLCGM